MLYAIDRKNGLKHFIKVMVELNSFVPSIHWILTDQKDLNNYSYDPEKLKNVR